MGSQRSKNHQFVSSCQDVRSEVTDLVELCADHDLMITYLQWRGLILQKLQCPKCAQEMVFMPHNMNFRWVRVYFSNA